MDMAVGNLVQAHELVDDIEYSDQGRCESLSRP